MALDSAIELTEKKKGLRPKSTKKTDQTEKSKTQSFTDGTSRYVPRSVKRFVLKRAGNQCEHIHPNGERCSSRYQLQFDHITAYSKGGKSTMDNMQLLCRVHNAFKQDR
ncbi:HNH endonuclease [compost metagenome]